jgi:hypothetical protein
MWLPFVFSSGWTSGVNAYMTVLELGLVGRFLDVGAVPDALTRTDVLIAAGVMYLIEFVTDKIPYVDSVWDTIHTLIRPAIGVAIGLLVTGDASSLSQALAGATGGLTAFASHLVKASSRLVINMSPEPVTNVTVSVGEDVAVGALVAVVVVAPWVAFGIAATLLLIGLWVVWVIHARIRSAVAAFRRRRARRHATAP